jgi:hypothetical protein
MIILNGKKNSGLQNKGNNSGEFKSGRLVKKLAVATSNLGTITICLKTEENQENLCRDGR